MDPIKIKISNERLWDIELSGVNIDAWLKDNVGYENYKEWFGLTALPYRSFEFKKKRDAMLFALTWL